MITSGTFSPSTALLVVDSIGVVIGIFSILMLYWTSRKLGGRVRKALGFVNGGIFFMTSSFILTIFFNLYHEMNMLDMNYHHLLMVIGMCLFIVAAVRFSAIARNL